VSGQRFTEKGQGTVAAAVDHAGVERKDLLAWIVETLVPDADGEAEYELLSKVVDWRNEKGGVSFRVAG